MQSGSETADGSPAASAAAAAADAASPASTPASEAFNAAVEAEASTVEASPAEASAAEASVAVPPMEPPDVILRARDFVADNPLVGYSLLALAAFVGGSFVLAVFRVAGRRLGPGNKRGRTVNKNKAVVTELAKFLPANRAGLTPAAVLALRLRTGVAPAKMFSTFLWFTLRDRKFDPDAVADLVALKAALGLRDADAAAVLKERAARVFAQYGAVMLDTSGMSAGGVERKASSRALFSKLLYLTECEELLAPEAAAGVDLRDVFGATEDDAARLRLASLYDVDLEAAVGLPSAPGEGGAAGGSSGDEE